MTCLEEGFKRPSGIEIKGGHGIFTPCRQLGGLRSHVIIVRSGSVCDAAVFLVSDTRLLAVRSESMKLIFVSLRLPHRRLSLDDHMSIFTVLREALLGYRGAYRFVFGADTHTRLWDCSDGRLIGDSVCPPLSGLPQKDADTTASRRPVPLSWRVNVFSRAQSRFPFRGPASGASESMSQERV